MIRSRGCSDKRNMSMEDKSSGPEGRSFFLLWTGPPPFTVRPAQSASESGLRRTSPRQFLPAEIRRIPLCADTKCHAADGGIRKAIKGNFNMLDFKAIFGSKHTKVRKMKFSYEKICGLLRNLLLKGIQKQVK